MDRTWSFGKALTKMEMIGAFTSAFSTVQEMPPLALLESIRLTPENGQRFPDVSADESGNFVITWQSQNDDATRSWDCYRRAYNNSGSALTGRSQISSSGLDLQIHPTVAAYGTNNYFLAFADEQDDGF